MRETIIFVALALAAPAALAQADEPTVNDTDYDTTPPADDQSYIDEAEMESTTMDDSEFDTTLPPDDQSYLTADVPAEGSSASGAGSSATPGLALVGVLGVIGALALLFRRS